MTGRNTVAIFLLCVQPALWVGRIESEAQSMTSIDPPQARNKTMATSRDKRRFKRGRSISPSRTLFDWFDKQKTTGGHLKRIRLPVSVSFDAAGWVVANARIGVGEKADGIAITLNDSALGIGLSDRARQMCATGSQCALWLEGVWRGRSNPLGQFDVLKVHRVIQDKERQTAKYVEVEVP